MMSGDVARAVDDVQHGVKPVNKHKAGCGQAGTDSTSTTPASE